MNTDYSNTPVDIVIPVYNEPIDTVRKTISVIKDHFSSLGNYQIIVVNDGSDAKYRIEALQEIEGIVYLEHKINRGYGSSLKTGILHGSAPHIAIIDADGTYPPESLRPIVDARHEADMVVGVRTGRVRAIPWLRVLPKKILNVLASYMSSTKISDLNSGMRIFTRELCYHYWGLLPNRFSFTSTITMGALVSGFSLIEIPIDYHKRVGKSSISPIYDTLKFLNIIIRMGILFYPMKLFFPISSFMILLGFTKGFLRDYLLLGAVGNASIMVILAGLQIFMLGYLAELIVSNRRLTNDRKS